MAPKLALVCLITTMLEKCVPQNGIYMISYCQSKKCLISQSFHGLSFHPSSQNTKTTIMDISNKWGGKGCPDRYFVGCCHFLEMAALTYH